MEAKFIVALVGIVCITAILCTSMIMGLNGQLVMAGLTIIGGIIGAIFGVTLKTKT